MDYPILELNAIVRHHLIHDAGIPYPPIDWRRLSKVQDFDPAVFAAASGVLGLLESTKLKAAEFAIAKTEEPLTYLEQLKRLKASLKLVNKPFVILHQNRNYGYVPKFALVLNLVELFNKLRSGKVRNLTDLVYPHIETNVDIIFTITTPELPNELFEQADVVITLESYRTGKSDQVTFNKIRGPNGKDYWLLKAILNDGFTVKPSQPATME